MENNKDRQELSSFIKHVHKSLRIQSTKLGVDEAWNSHCLDEKTLERYAKSMQILATQYWDSKNSEELLASSRIEWIVNQCREYFFEKGIEKQYVREQKILEILGLNYAGNRIFLADNVIKLLDVGSCYNPFKKFDFFDVLAIDIAPANNNVYKCDFTSVNIVNESITKNLNLDTINELVKESYHAVVFSLLLDYLPSPELRLAACLKAYDLLKTEGIMIIISPDSKHVGANAKYMKCWRYTLSTIGFSRIKYEKLSHIHCMVFRKSIKPEIPQRWADIHKEEAFMKNLCIPQDFKIITENIESESSSSTEKPEEVLHYFQELPDI